MAEYSKRLQEKAEENKKKTEEFHRKQREERKKLFEVSSQPAGFNMTDIEEQLRQLEGQYTDSEEDVSEDDLEEPELDSQGEEEDIEQLIDDLYCVACDKLFKTVGAKDNHETSKKHRENMEKLVREMREEEAEANASEGNSEDHEETVTPEIAQQSNMKGKSKKQKKKQKKSQQAFTVEKSSDSEAEKETVQTAPNGFDANFSSDDDDRKRQKKGKKKNKKSKLPNTKADIVIDDNEVTESNCVDTDKVEPSVEGSEVNQVKNKKSKSKKSNISKNVGDGEEESLSRDLTCAQCKGDFPSKNKLFDHLKKTGHAVYIPPSNGVQETNKKKKKKK